MRCRTFVSGVNCRCNVLSLHADTRRRRTSDRGRPSRERDWRVLGLSHDATGRQHRHILRHPRRRAPVAREHGSGQEGRPGGARARVRRKPAMGRCRPELWRVRHAADRDRPHRDDIPPRQAGRPGLQRRAVRRPAQRAPHGRRWRARRQPHRRPVGGAGQPHQGQWGEGHNVGDAPRLHLSQPCLRRLQHRRHRCHAAGQRPSAGDGHLHG